jgi:HSF-type DNA-binding
VPSFSGSSTTGSTRERVGRISSTGGSRALLGPKFFLNKFLDMLRFTTRMDNNKKLLPVVLNPTNNNTSGPLPTTTVDPLSITQMLQPDIANLRRASLTATTSMSPDQGRNIGAPIDLQTRIHLLQLQQQMQQQMQQQQQVASLVTEMNSMSNASLIQRDDIALLLNLELARARLDQRNWNLSQYQHLSNSSTAASSRLLLQEQLAHTIIPSSVESSLFASRSADAESRALDMLINQQHQSRLANIGNVLQPPVMNSITRGIDLATILRLDELRRQQVGRQSESTVQHFTPNSHAMSPPNRNQDHNENVTSSAAHLLPRNCGSYNDHLQISIKRRAELSHKEEKEESHSGKIPIVRDNEASATQTKFLSSPGTSQSTGALKTHSNKVPTSKQPIDQLNNTENDSLASQDVSSANIEAYGDGSGSINETFPFKLYRMLVEAEENGDSDIISFLPHGCAFVIHKPKLFSSKIMLKYFTTGRLSSFQR